MWATVIAKTAKYLVWVKSNQHRVSLTVVLFVFPHPPTPTPHVKYAQPLHGIAPPCQSHPGFPLQVRQRRASTACDNGGKHTSGARTADSLKEILLACKQSAPLTFSRAKLLQNSKKTELPSFPASEADCDVIQW